MQFRLEKVPRAIPIMGMAEWGLPGATRKVDGTEMGATI